MEIRHGLHGHVAPVDGARAFTAKKQLGTAHYLQSKTEELACTKTRIIGVDGPTDKK
jgi:hypothetical protein